MPTGHGLAPDLTKKLSHVPRRLSGKFALAGVMRLFRQLGGQPSMEIPSWLTGSRAAVVINGQTLLNRDDTIRLMR